VLWKTVYSQAVLGFVAWAARGLEVVAGIQEVLRPHGRSCHGKKKATQKEGMMVKEIPLV
jgi:hypothetical protein